MSFAELIVNETGPIKGRVPFTKLPEWKEKKNFVDIHLSKNYDWIISKIEIGENGYVKKRD